MLIAAGRVEHDISADLMGALQPAKKKNYRNTSIQYIMDGSRGDLLLSQIILNLHIFFLENLNLLEKEYKIFLEGKVSNESS